MRSDARQEFTRQPAYELQGAHGIGVGGFALTECFVPDAMLLYPAGEAFKVAMQSVNRARVHVAAMNAGLLDASLSAAVRYGAKRRAFDASLLDFQGLRWSLVGVATDLEALPLACSQQGAPDIDSPTGMLRKPQLWQRNSAMIGRIRALPRASKR